MLGWSFIDLRFQISVIFSISLGTKGTIQLSGLFDFINKENDNELNPQAVVMAKAMELAVKNLNLTFKYKVDFNKKPLIKKLNCIKEMSNYSVFGIGPMYPRDTNRLSETDGTFISYYSSEENSFHHQSAVFRVTPPDSFRIQALLDIVRELKWKYVSVISSYGENGRAAAHDFIKRIERAQSCLDKHVELPAKSSMEEFKKISTLNSSAIICFTMGQDTVDVMGYLQQDTRTRPQLLFAFSTINYGEIAKKPAVASGTLFLDFPSIEVSGFSEYICKNDCNTLKDYQPLPVWCENKYSNFSLCKKIPVIYKHVYKNTVNLIKSNQSPLCCNAGYSNSSLRSKQTSHFFSPVKQVMTAVQVLAEAIESSAKENSKYLGVKARQKLVRDYLRTNVRCNYVSPSNYKDEDDDIIKYDLINLVTNGSSYYLAKVGSWSQNRSVCDEQRSGKLKLHVTSITWMSENKGKAGKYVPGIICRQNEASKRIKGVNSCWECRRCENNEIVANDTCKPCNRNEKPDKRYRKCIVLPYKTLDFQMNWQTKLILTCTLIGIGSVLCVAVMYIKYRNSKVIKASGRELSTFILLGVLLTFLNSFVFIHPPGKVNCSLRQILPGFAFYLCYGPLLLKVNRIYRIFANAKKLEETILTSPRSQVLLVLGIAAFQLIPGCAWIMKSVPISEIEYPVHRNYVVLYCPFDHFGFFLNLILGVAFMLGSTWYAFKTRAFPRNYNESKYIGISLYVICICWALFIPSMFFIKPSNEFLREYMICSICIMVGYTVLVGIFVPKVKRLLSSSTENKNSVKNENVTSSGTFSSTFSSAIQVTSLHGSSN